MQSFNPENGQPKDYWSQNIDGDGNHQVQVGGDLTGPVIGQGGINIGDGNSGITITSIATTGQPKRRFDIKKKTRIPVPASAIGLISAILSIVGFTTGATSIAQLVTLARRGTLGALRGTPPQFGWLMVALVAFALSAFTFMFWRFLRRNVLWLPKRWVFRAWAGLKEESGRTYPYALRLSMLCPSCAGNQLRFNQVPIAFTDIIDSGSGNVIKRVPSGWGAKANCSRYAEHSLSVDLADNDFDAALPRR